MHNRSAQRIITLLTFLGYTGIAFLGWTSFATASVYAQETVVFQGLPGIKISEGGLERVPIGLPQGLAATAECVVIEENGKFYWASRRRVEMGAVRNGPFVTYVALNGTGYVRVFDRSQAVGTTVTPAEERFDYVEHILLGLRSVTYYGNAVPDAAP